MFEKINYHVLNFILLTAKDDPIDFAVGGQAVIEGVMMRSPNHITIAVRKKKGHIKVKNREYQTITQRIKLLNIPIIRGVINLFEMMVLGTQAINFSSNEYVEDEFPDEKGKKVSSKEDSHKKQTSLNKAFEAGMFMISLIVAIGFSLLLFKFLPLGITTFLDSHFAFINENYIVFNIIDGIIKISIFLTYIYLLTLIPSFRRVFEYHGAEHKSIFTYEKKLPLEVKHAKNQTRFHPRCGTSFILIVFVISILVYTLVPKQETFLQNFALRVTFLPLIAGISYELLKLSAKFKDHVIVKMLVAPGLAFQKLTTKEPSDHQLEVGLKSLRDALELEKSYLKN